MAAAKAEEEEELNTKQRWSSFPCSWNLYPAGRAPSKIHYGSAYYFCTHEYIVNKYLRRCSSCVWIFMNGAQVCVHALPAAPWAPQPGQYTITPERIDKISPFIHAPRCHSLFMGEGWAQNWNSFCPFWRPTLSTARNKTLFGKRSRDVVREPRRGRKRQRATGLAFILTSISWGPPT